VGSSIHFTNVLEWEMPGSYLASDAIQKNEERQLLSTLEGIWSCNAGILHGWVITVTYKKK